MCAECLVGDTWQTEVLYFKITNTRQTMTRRHRAVNCKWMGHVSRAFLSITTFVSVLSPHC